MALKEQLLSKKILLKKNQEFTEFKKRKKKSDKKHAVKILKG